MRARDKFLSVACSSGKARARLHFLHPLPCAYTKTSTLIVKNDYQSVPRRRRGACCDHRGATSEGPPLNRCLNWLLNPSKIYRVVVANTAGHVHRGRHRQVLHLAEGERFRQRTLQQGGGVSSLAGAAQREQDAPSSCCP